MVRVQPQLAYHTCSRKASVRGNKIRMNSPKLHATCTLHAGFNGEFLLRFVWTSVVTRIPGYEVSLTGIDEAAAEDDSDQDREYYAHEVVVRVAPVLCSQKGWHSSKKGAQHECEAGQDV